MILALIILLSVLGYCAGIFGSAYLGGRFFDFEDARALALGYIFWPLLLVIAPFFFIFLLADVGVSTGSKRR